MVESLVETLEIAQFSASYLQEASQILILQEAHGVHASIGDNARLILKIDMIPNIPVATGKGPWVSRLTSRSVPIALS